MVSASDQGLGRIFGNIVGNGVKYTPRGGSVRVKLAVEGKGAVVTVADTGMGIPKDELPKLWTEFYRASNARQSDIVGTGLGLSIVKRLVASFGGLVTLESEEGKGTTFTVSLPLVEVEPSKAEGVAA
jgi:two-component system phosphate regulon sensor histidine kinase PhoR